MTSAATAPTSIGRAAWSSGSVATGDGGRGDRVPADSRGPKHEPLATITRCGSLPPGGFEMRAIGWVWLPIVGLCGACVSNEFIPLSQNTIMVSTTAAPACGRGGAQRVAISQAAAETIRRGYDKFIVVGRQSANNVQVVGHTPVVGSTTITGTSYGTSLGNTYNSTFSGTGTTTYSGGTPIIGGSHDQDFAIMMFRTCEPGSENAIDARTTLGPKWAEIVAKKQNTCW